MKRTSGSKRFLALGSCLAFVVATAPAWGDALSDMAQRLSGLRAEVEALSQDMATRVAEGRDRLRSLSRQKTELALEVQRERTRIEKLRQAVAERRRAVEAEQQKQNLSSPLFKKLSQDAKAYVASTVPFHTEQRLAEIAKLEEQYEAGLLTAPKAVSRLWAFLEDEFRLTRESGLYTQTLNVGGQEHLGDVVRIGMVMMFFRLGDGAVGRVRKQEGQWAYEVLDDPEAQRQVEELFASFKKQIRVGHFELPAALSLGEVQP